MNKKSKTNEFIEYLKEILPEGTVSKVHAMFGGYSIYQDNIVYALIAYNELYFKANDELSKIFKKYGSEPFVYYGKNNKKITMSYWKVPPEVLDNYALLAEWQKLSYEVAKSIKMLKK